MEKLLFIRHVSCTAASLTDDGKGQLERLSERLEPHASGVSLVLLSSPSPRARLTAEPLEKLFHTRAHPFLELWSDVDRPVDAEKIMKLIELYADRAGILLLVTHHECAAFMPAYYCAKAFGLPVDYRDAQPGEGIGIDVVGKELFSV